jgi:hypothetical protein
MAQGLRCAADLGLGVAARAGALCLGRRIWRRAYLEPLWRRSRVLRGASVTLHAVRPETVVAGGRAGAPAPELHELELTVHPRSQRGLPRWHADDLALVAPGARPDRPEEDLEVGHIVEAFVWRHGAFEPATGRPLFGAERLRLRVAFRPGARRFHFRYYLELLGRAPVPA